MPADSAVVPVGEGETWLGVLRGLFGQPRWRPGRADRLVVSPPLETTLLKSARVPPLAAGPRAAVLGFEVRQALPFPPETLCWGAVKTGTAGEDDEFLVAALRRETAESLGALLLATRAADARIVPAALALAVAGNVAGVRIVAEREATLLLFRCGARLAARVVTHPADGGDAGGAERLTAELARTLAANRRQFEVETLGRVQVAGAAETVAALAPALAVKLGVPVEAPESDATGDLATVRALAGFTGDTGRERVDLTPADLRDSHAMRRRQYAWLAAAALLVLAVAPWPWLLRREWQALHAAERAVAREIAPLRAAEARQRAHGAALAGARAELAALQRVEFARSRWTELLAALDAAFAGTEGAWIERLEWLPEGAAPVRTVFTAEPNAVASAATIRVRLGGLVAKPTGNSVAPLADARGLLRRVANCTPVAAVERERFDDSRPEGVGFEADLVLRWETVR